HCSAPPSAAYIGVSPPGECELIELMSACSCVSAGADAAVSVPRFTAGCAQLLMLHDWALLQVAVPSQQLGVLSGPNRRATPSPAEAGSWTTAVSAAIAGTHRFGSSIDPDLSTVTNMLTFFNVAWVAEPPQLGTPHAPLL